MRLIDADPIERMLFKEADKSLAKNPYEKARICAFRSAFEMVSSAPTITPPPNDPLSLEQLREMDGEPVYIAPVDGGPYTWMLVDTEYEVLRGAHGELAVFENCGKTWIAYRRKPQETTLEAPPAPKPESTPEDISEGAEKRAILQRLTEHRKAHSLGCLADVAKATRSRGRISDNTLRMLLAGEAQLPIEDWRRIGRALDRLEQKKAADG